MLDRARELWVAPSRSRNSPTAARCLGKLDLQSVQMLDDQPVSRLRIGRGQDRLHLGDRHLQASQPADHLSGL